MKNNKPEKIVENLVRFWASKNGFWLHVIESKATYSKNLKRYLRGNAPEGFSDINGITPCNKPAYIELKAPGKRSTASYEQIVFLLQAIQRGAFAVVIDSPELLGLTYSVWVAKPEDERKQFLISRLPEKHLMSATKDLKNGLSSFKELVSFVSGYEL